MARKRKKRSIPREAYALAAIVVFWIAGYVVVQWRQHFAEKRIVALVETKLKAQYGWTKSAAVEVGRRRLFLSTCYWVVLVKDDPQQTVAMVTVFDDSIVKVEIATGGVTEGSQPPGG